MQGFYMNFDFFEMTPIVTIVAVAVFVFIVLGILMLIVSLSDEIWERSVNVI